MRFAWLPLLTLLSAAVFTEACPEGFLACANYETTRIRSIRNCYMAEERCDGVYDCPDGSDERPELCNNSTRTKDACLDWSHFTCRDGHCLDKSKICDGSPDCPDRSDEDDKLCAARDPDNHHQCPGSYDFACFDPENTCIPKSWICDGIAECPNRRDELTSTCNSHLHQCGPVNGNDAFRCLEDGVCLDGSKECDGIFDCADHSDEAYCPPTCSLMEFACASLHCIGKELVCDGKADCEDGSDETPSTCKTAANLSDASLNPCRNKPDDPFGDGSAKCDHFCHFAPVDRSVYCSCKPGFRLYENGRSCVDVNECLDPSSCSQTCLNTIGSYECRCNPGYEEVGRNMCIAPGTSNRTLLLDAGRGVQRVVVKNPTNASSMDDSFVSKEIVTFSFGSVSIDFDFRSNVLFWADHLHRALYRAPMDSSDRGISSTKTERLMPHVDVGVPRSIAYDWLTGNLYWADEATGSIRLLNTTSNFTTTVVHRVDRPVDLVLDPIRSSMYWSQNGRDGRTPAIYKASMDGTGRSQLLVGAPSVGLAESLALDMDREVPRLFWLDRKLAQIRSASVDDGPQTHSSLPIEQSNFRRALSLDVFENHIYWTDDGSRRIQITSKLDGRLVHWYALAESHVTDLKVLHPFKQPRPAEMACRLAPCRFACVNLAYPASGFVCLCPDGRNRTGADCPDLFRQQEAIKGEGKDGNGDGSDDGSAEQEEKLEGAVLASWVVALIAVCSVVVLVLLVVVICRVVWPAARKTADSPINYGLFRRRARAEDQVCLHDAEQELDKSDLVAVHSEKELDDLSAAPSSAAPPPAGPHVVITSGRLRPVGPHRLHNGHLPERNGAPFSTGRHS